jgi:serine/threonine protein kinase
MDAPTGCFFRPSRKLVVVSNIYETLEANEEIGSGTYGTVCAINDRYVVKKIKNRRRYTPHSSAIREIAYLRYLNDSQSFIVPLISVGQDITYSYYIMQKAAGTIFSYNGILTPNNKLSIAYQVGNALAYLHCRNIIHRDIKGDNILLYPSYESPKNIIARLADFGDAIICTKNIALAKEKYTLWYRPPELLFSEDSLVYYDSSADIWAYGITVWQLWDYDAPTMTISLDKLKDAIIDLCENKESRSKIFDKLMAPTPIINILQQILSLTPGERPSALEIISNSVFDNVRCHASEPVPLYLKRVLKSRELYPTLRQSTFNYVERNNALFMFIKNDPAALRVFFYTALLFDSVSHIKAKRPYTSDDLAIACNYIAKSFFDDDLNLNSYSRVSRILSGEVLKYLEWDVHYTTCWDFYSLEDDTSDAQLKCLIMTAFMPLRYKYSPSKLCEMVISEEINEQMCIDFDAVIWEIVNAKMDS